MTSLYFLAFVSSLDYTLHILYLVNAGTPRQKKDARYRQAMIDLTHLFRSAVELSVPKCVMGTHVKTSSKTACSLTVKNISFIFPFFLGELALVRTDFPSSLHSERKYGFWGSNAGCTPY